MFSNYGLEFIEDTSTELDSLTPTTTELKSSYYNYITPTDGDGTHKILKLKVSKSEFSGIVSAGYIADRVLFFINMSTQTGSNSGQPNSIFIQKFASSSNNSTDISAKAYCDNTLGMNIIEITIGRTDYAKAEVLPIHGSLYSTDYITDSEYDSEKHLSLKQATIL